MSIILGIDYGLKHTGLSIARTSLAEPLYTVPTSDLISEIERLHRESPLTLVVFGLSEGAMAAKTKTFAQTLEAKLHLPTVFHDETLTSHETRQKLARSRLKKSKREAKIDHYVAAAILQDYLDTHNVYAKPT